MGDQRKGGIAWTDETWNPIRGCSRVSEGCRNCYAEAVASRFSGPGQPYEGLARAGKWTGEVRLVPEHLADPLHWRRPRRIFVNSMSDLFHETFTDEEIAAVFGVMAASPQHTFQVLTKRPERMRRWFEWAREQALEDGEGRGCPWYQDFLSSYAATHLGDGSSGDQDRLFADIGERQRTAWARPGSDGGTDWSTPWPLPNVWGGVSVEDQDTADRRVPLLLQTPAAVRFVSAEPLLGPVELREEWLRGRFIECPDESQDADTDPCLGCPGYTNPGGDHCGAVRGPHLDWLIVGGESGPGARPFDLAWARSLVRQCREAGVACFVKQLGARPKETGLHGACRDLRLRDRSGADLSEWPEDLRVQQFPGGFVA